MILYLCETGTEYQPFEAKLSLLPAERQERVQHFYDTQSRTASIAAYLLLVYGLKEAYDIPKEQIRWTYSAQGKPHMDGMFFNLSHDHTLVACALSETACGCDVMRLRPIKKTFLKRFCAPAEVADIASAKDREGAFAQVWTKKESLIKLYAGSILCRLNELDTTKAAESFYTGGYQDYRYACCTAEPVDFETRIMDADALLSYEY